MPEYVRVKVITKAKIESIALKNGVLLVSVRQPREENKANLRVRELVAEYYAIPKTRVQIVKGHKHSQKLFLISD